MKSSLVVIGLSLLTLAPPAFSADTAPASRQDYCEREWRTLPTDDAARAPGYKAFMQHCLSDCPDKRHKEADTAYTDRTHTFCEISWRDLSAAHRTGKRTHDEYVAKCRSRCGVPLWPLAGLAGLGGLAAGGGGKKPASP